MRHMVNGCLVKVFTISDGSVSPYDIRRGAGIPEDSPHVLECPMVATGSLLGWHEPPTAHHPVHVTAPMVG
jgi:hypothetical protein